MLEGEKLEVRVKRKKRKEKEKGQQTSEDI